MKLLNFFIGTQIVINILIAVVIYIAFRKLTTSTKEEKNDGVR